MNTTDTWQGRDDSEDSGITTRWHQRMHAFDAKSGGGMTLIGFACDAGVRRNGGRPGAAKGPAAIRAALANMPVLGEPALWDAGDVACAEDELEAAQGALAGRVACTLAQHSLPLVLGGGHEVAWGTYQGLRQALGPHPRVLIVNFDAHFDLREASQANSGTPFRQISQACAATGQRFDYGVFGISRYANTQALFDRADALGVRYWLDDALQDAAGLAAAQAALHRDIATCDAIYLTIDLDVLPGGQAPGVSAPAALGVPLPIVQALIDPLLASGKVAAVDIAELNPSLDRDGLTAKVAARLVARIARGVSPHTAPSGKSTGR